MATSFSTQQRTTNNEQRTTTTTTTTTKSTTTTTTTTTTTINAYLMLGFGVVETFIITNYVTITVSAITAAIVVVFKDIYLEGSDSVRKLSIRQDMKKRIDLIDCENDAQSVLAENKGLQEALFEMFTIARKQGGLYIIGSPAHTGKSVYLQEALYAYRNSSLTQGGDIKYMKAIKFEFENSEKSTMEFFKSSLDIPSDKQMKEFIPAGSLIIIDQFDLPTLSEDHADFFRKLATTSFNCKKFAVIVNVSNAIPFKEMLELNQGQKVFPACDPRLFQFNEKMMRQYIVRLDPHCSDVDEYVGKALPYKSIGVLRSYLMCSRRKNGFQISSHGPVDWANFEEVYDTHT